MDDAGKAELRLGRWQDVLADVECDALIFDAPYGERTHSGHNRSGAIASAAGKYVAKSGRIDSRRQARSDITYDHMDADAVREFVSWWSPRTRGWIGSLTCSDLAGPWRDAMHEAGRMTFAPIPVVDRGSRVRLTGDGPSNWTVWLVVARPRSSEFARWGTLPGVYERSQGDPRSTRMGGKPLGVMRSIVRDYSRPGDLVCDPFAGHATTLLAALMEGRRAVGSEMDPEAYEAAQRRLGRGYQPSLF